MGTKKEPISKEDRIKALKERINSKFGKDKVVKLGEVVEKVDMIPSNVKTLDFMLGGGVPRGRMIELFGNEGCSKCLVKDSYILSEDGLLTLEEIFLLNGEFAVNTKKQINKQYSLLNMNNELEDTVAFTFNGKRKIRKITTNSGRVIKTTLNHPLRVMGESGFLTWRITDNIKVGDFVAVRRPTNNNYVFGKNDDITEDQAYAIGLMIADGTFENKSISISNDDPDIINFIKTKISNLFNFSELKEYKRSELDNSYTFCFSSKEKVQEFYKNYEIKEGVSKDKKIPQSIRMGTKEIVASFLRGYLDVESFTSFDKSLIVTSSSYDLLYQVKMLLEMFGIISELFKMYVKNYEDNDYYGLKVTGKNLELLIKEIGTSSSKVKERYDEILEYYEKVKHNDNLDIIPNLRCFLKDTYYNIENRSKEILRLIGDYIYTDDKNVNITYYGLKKILNILPDSIQKQHLQDLYDRYYYYDRVIAVEDLEEQLPTFDFAMSKTHSFIAEGIVNHNTSLANTIIANAQKLGGMAAVIDAEYGYNSEYARALGVNTDDLILAKPTSTEEAFKILEDMLKEKIFDVIVFDSIAALASESELAGEIGQATVAINARLISSILRRLTSLISESNTCVIFINQLRANLSLTGYGGGGEITPGGKALKFFSSMRIEMKKISSIKKGDEVIGQKLNVRALKNRFAKPYKVVTLEYLYDTGFSTEGMLIDLAIDAGLIEKAGAWLKYKDKKFNGKESLRLALSTTELSLAKELEEKVDEYIKTGKISLPEELEDGDVVEERKEKLEDGDFEIESVNEE